MNATHMMENLNVFDFSLSTEEMNTLSNLPQDTCDVDPDWAECVRNP